MIHYPVTVAELISALSQAGNGDTISLRPGSIYRLTSVNNSFNGPNGLPVINRSLTVIGNGATLIRSSDAPAFRILQIASGNVVLKGIVICGGYVQNADGAGIYNAGSLSLTNCTIRENTMPATSDKIGGGVYNSSSATAIISNCIIANNRGGENIVGSAGGGGGIGSRGTLIVTHCTIKDNYGRSGGGLHLRSATTTIKDTFLTGNLAENGAGAYVWSGTCVVEGSDFIENHATGAGGAICGRALSRPTITLRHNRIVGNTMSSAAVETGPAPDPRVDAIENWWGASNGPSGAGPGNGDSVTSVVDYSPWLTSEDCIHEAICDCPINYAANDCFTSGNPISLRFGEKRQEETDLTVQTPTGALAFQRSYRQDKQADEAFQFMGLGWTHNHDTHLEDPGSTNPIAIYTPRGGKTQFKFREAVGSISYYNGAAGSGSSLTVDWGSTSARYTLTAADKSIFVFDSDQRLRTRSWPNNESLTYTYDASNRLASVTDSAYDLGDDTYRCLQFSYITNPNQYDDNKLWRVGDHTASGLDSDNPTGRFIEFGYASEKIGGDDQQIPMPKALLVSVKDVKGNIFTYDYYGQHSGETDTTLLNRLTKRLSPLVDTTGNGQADETITFEDLTYGSHQVELAVNGGMEVDSGWRKVGAPLTNERSSTQVESGAYSRRVIVNTVGTGIEGNIWRLELGRKYTVTAKVYLVPPQGGGTVTVKMQATGTTAFDQTTSIVGIWQTLTVTDYVPVGALDCRLQFIATQLGSSGTAEFFVDSVSIQESNLKIVQRRGIQGTSNPLLETTFKFAPSLSVTTEELAEKTTTHRFDRGLYAQNEDSAGNSVFQSSNSQFRVAEQIDANGNHTWMNWSDTGKTLDKVIDAQGHETAFYYANELLDYSFDAEGRKTEYTYDDTNNPRLPTCIKVLDKNGTTVLRWQEFTYDNKGRVLTEQTFDLTDPLPGNLAHQVTRTYYISGNGNGLLQLVQQHDTQQSSSTIDTEYTYDQIGRVIKTSQHSTFGSCQYSYTVYDAAGNVEATVCGRDDVVTPPTSVAAAQAMYDANHPVKKDNRVTVHQYDALNRRVATTVNAGSAFEQTTLTFYDALNRVWRTINNYINQSGEQPESPALWIWNNGWKKSDGTTPISHGGDHTQNLIQDTVYNARGLVESQMDVAGHVTRLVYNDAGRVVRTISNYVPQGSSDPAAWGWANNRWEYSAGQAVNHGNNDQNLITEQEYDAVGNLVKTVDLLRNVTLTGYDELNRPVKTIRNASQPNYDILADLDLSAYSAYSAAADQDLVETTDYDALGRVVRTQRLVSIEGAVKQWDTTLYGYDSLGRQVKVIRAASIPDYGFSHPDLAGYGGYVDNLSVPDQDIVSLTAYNPAGQVAFTEDALHRQTYFVYDGFGRQIKTITNYVPQGDSDPATWTWSAVRQQWERSLTNQTPIEHGSENDQNLIQETFYDSDGKVLATRDLLGRLNRNVYENGRLKLSVANLTAADPSNWVWANNRWEDSSGNLVEHGSANDQNSITETLYDVQGRVEATRDGLGRVSRQVFDDLGRVVRTVTNYTPQRDSQGREAYPENWYWDAVAQHWKGQTKDAAGVVLETISITHGADNDENIVASTVYDVQGRVAQTIDHRNNATLYIYDYLGRRVKTIASYLEQGPPVTDPANWVWSATNHQWEDGSGSAIEFGADKDQNRISTTTYDWAGRVASTRDAAGIETRFEYDMLGRRVTTITNYMDGTYSASLPDQDLISTTTYNKGGQVALTTDARNTQTAFTYDQAGRRLTVTQAAGSALASTTYTCYDKAGRILRTIANWTNDPAQFAPDAKDTSGNWRFVPQYNGAANDRDVVTVFDYDLAGRRIQVTDPLGNTTSTTYFKDGQVQSLTDPENGGTQYRYDGLRRRTRVVQSFTNQGEDPAWWKWDATQNPARWETSLGTALTHGANNDQNIIVDVVYDEVGRVLSQRDPRGNVTTYEYDKLNRRKTLTNPISQTWSTVYSDLTDGKTRTTMTYPGLADTGNYPVQRDFDRLGRLREIHYHPAATPPFVTPQVNFVYDALGNRKQMIESNGAITVRQTEFVYDALHRLTSAKFDNNSNGTDVKTVSYEYDAGGLQTKLSLPDNLSVTYTYDQRGQLVSLTDWDDQPTQFAYDLAGRHIATERANGLGSRYEYDAAGRLRHLRHQERNKVLARFQYQVDGRGNRTQVFEQVAQPSAVVATLDKANAAVAYYQGVWADSGAFKVTTQFEAAMRVTFTGNEARLTLSTGPDHSIFDIYVDGSLWESFDGYASSAGERQINLYLTSGGQHVVNIRNRPERNTGNSTEPPVYQVGFKQLEVLETTYDQQTIQYEYDALARLLDAKYFPGSDMGATMLRRHQFTYDRAGNRLSEAVALNGGTPTVTTYTYNNANQLTDDGPNTYEYDPNGNLWKTNDVVTHTWDRANQLLSMGGAAYRYDGLGNRVQQTVGTDVTRYLLDLQPGLAVVLAATKGMETTRYVHSPRGIHAQQDSQNEWDWIVQDGLGSVRGVVNNTADVLESRLYSPYGGAFGGSMTTDPNYNSPVYGFTGEPMDANSLLYLRARYYSPNLGVFASLDPFEGMASRPMSLNGYSWVEGNVPSKVDPSGMITDLEFAHRANMAYCAPSPLEEDPCRYCKFIEHASCTLGLTPPCPGPTQTPIPSQSPIVIFMGGSYADNNTEFLSEHCSPATIYDDGPNPFHQTSEWLNQLVGSEPAFRPNLEKEPVGCSKSGIKYNGPMYWYSNTVKPGVNAHGVLVVRYNGSKEKHAVAAFTYAHTEFGNSLFDKEKRPIIVIGYSSGADSALFFAHIYRHMLNIRSVTSLGPTFSGGLTGLPGGTLDGNETQLLSDVLQAGTIVNVVDDSGNSTGDVKGVVGQDRFNYYDVQTVRGFGINEHFDREDEGDGTNNNLSFIQRIYCDLGLIPCH